MALEYITADLDVITEILDLDTEDSGLPAKGEQSGPGRHAYISDVQDSPGWTWQRHPVIESDAGDEFLITIDDQFNAVTEPKLTGLARAAYVSRKSEYPPGYDQRKPKKIRPKTER